MYFSTYFLLQSYVPYLRIQSLRSPPSLISLHALRLHCVGSKIDWFPVAYMYASRKFSDDNFFAQLRMDHHCPFTNCCVGLLNERFFVAWVFCVWLGNLYGSLLSWKPFMICIFGGIVNGIDSLSESDLTRCTNVGKSSFMLLPAGALLSFMTILLFWHLFLISQVCIPDTRITVQAPKRNKQYTKWNLLRIRSVWSFFLLFFRL